MNTKHYIIYALALLVATPLGAWAQDEADGEPAEAAAPRKVRKAKQYPTREIAGTVVDGTTGKPLAGAIVKAQGMEGYSALTEDNGSYKLKLPTFASAIVVKLSDFNSTVIGLADGEQQRAIRLYPTTFDAENSLAVNNLGDRTATDFHYTNAINIKEEVQKQLGAYAYTVQRNGTPGIGDVMRIQGINSLNANAQPLIVVDGVIFDQQNDRQLLHSGFFNDILSVINPADIEKVTVVRNGTALYGAKGANGVVLIDTRRCKSMATRITATASAGITFLPKFIDVMGAEQYRGYASELLGSTNTKLTKFSFLDPRESNYYKPKYYNSTDWKDDIYKEALTQNYGINIEGGDAVATYNLSVGYTTAGSTLECNNLHRLNVRFNTDISLSQKFAVRFDASFGNETRNIRNDGAPSTYDDGTCTSPAFLAYVKSPFLSPYGFGFGHISDTQFDIDPEDYLNQALSGYKNYNWRLANPLAVNEYGEAENKNRVENSLLNLSVTPKFQILPNLFVQSQFSYNVVNTNEKYYVPINGVPNYYVSSISKTVSNEVRAYDSKQTSVQSDTRVDWNQRFDAHYIHAFAGCRINWERYTLNNQLGYNTGSDKTPFMSSGLQDAQTEGTKDKWNSMSAYLQAEYNYLGRYFLQANLTADGNSRFGADASGLKALGTQWAIFPGVQAAWVLTNEKWGAKIPGVDFLRLSAGFDVSGNDDIYNYAGRSFFRANKLINAVAGLVVGGIGNTEIKWETTRRLNLGLEGSFLGNRLALSFNYFRSWTSDLLSLQELNYLTGLETNWANGGKMENQGFDVAFNAKVLALKDWQWQVGASMGHYKNKITQLADNKQFVDSQLYGATVRTQVGSPAGLFYGYKTDGVFATTADANKAGLSVLDANGIDRHAFQAGDMRFIDSDNNGSIDEADRFVIGDPNPDIYGNIFTTLAYKRFKLDIRLNYVLGNDVYNYMRSQLEGGSRFMNQTTAMLSRWQVEGQQTSMPRATFQDPMGNSRFSDRWIEDGSYLRLKAVTLSYDLPIKSEFIQGFQFWIQGNNLLTFSKYLGSDPEFAYTGSVLGQGIDTGCLPQSRSIVAGVKINL